MATATKADLRTGRRRITLNGSKQAAGEPDVAKKRGAVKNPDTPLGQTAAFMRHRMERLGLSYKDLAMRLQKAGWEGSHHAVRKWLTGANGPTLGDLRYVAEALGYADWVGFVAAVGRYRDES